MLLRLYLTDVNKPSVDAFTEAEAKDMVTFHLIQDTLLTNQFKDGKLPTVTMYGQYLVSGVTNTNGVSSITINRQALITQGQYQDGQWIYSCTGPCIKTSYKIKCPINFR